ncbi:MAG: S8 family serine peptidase [Sedimentisphaerales bacterium]|nr:S8 family serine peptidase [Sedimentisphaerales bacterium]
MSSFSPGLSLIKLPENLSVEEAVSRCKNLPGVINAQPNYIKRVLAIPDDANFSYLWGLNNEGQPYLHGKTYGGGFLTGTPDADIDAPEAWDINTDSNIIVAVIDTGIDYNHPDLKANMWINPGEDHDPCGVVDPNDFDGVDDDGNGYIDDIYGWDFYNNDNNPIDERFHGTHVAGIIGAVGNNAQGVTGVCWNVKIMAIKAADSGGYLYTWSIVPSIYYAISKGAKVINASYGGPDFDPEEKSAIEAADAAGVLLVASAGNIGWNIEIPPKYNFPASYDCNNIISVMATDANDQKASWSNYGPISVDLASPGVDIFSTFPTYRTSAMDAVGFDVNYETLSGTSMAAPYVSGACALLWAVHPNMKHYHVKQGILDTVDKLPLLEYDPNHDGRQCVTGGRLNLNKALLYKPNLFTFTKEYYLGGYTCVLPESAMRYIMTLDANECSDSNVKIIDYIPVEINEIVAMHPPFILDENDRTITWDVGAVSVGDSNEFHVQVYVNDLAEPLGAIRNICMYEGDHSKGFAEVNTPVCAWNPGVIYVDDSAVSGGDTGMRWEDAYVDLNDALTRASQDCGDEIWVAGGTYIPSAPDPYYWGGYPTFLIVDDVPLYGHFAGNETSISQRDLKDPASESILNGAGSGIEDVVTVYYLSQQNILDGFTITNGGTSGVRLSSASLVISNCLINANAYGIYAEESGISVADCIIQNNSSHGINANYNYADVPETRIENSIIRNNQTHGIYLNQIDSNAMILNNLIHNNRVSGITFGATQNHFPEITIRNNTIVRNGTYGIDPEVWVPPEVSNCIIKGHTYEYYWYGPTYGFYAKYSCIEEDDPNQYQEPGNSNINSDPCFVGMDVNNFHLKPVSDCINRGDPNFNDVNETDIDGESRIVNGRVDMGADEVYWPKADYNLDEIVNFIDFAQLAGDWQSPDSNKTLDGDADVDIDDLALFCDDWLWIAPWSEFYGMLMGQSGGDMSITVEGESEQQVLDEDIPANEPQEITDQPMSDEQIQALLDWSEELWESNPDIREMVGQEAYERVIESLREQLAE